MRKVDIIGIHDKAEDEPFLNTDKRNESPDPCPSTMQSIYVAVPADLKGYLQKRVGETRAHTTNRSNFRNDVENSEGACILHDEPEDSRSNSASNTSITSRSKKHRPIACYSIIILQIFIFLAMVSTQGFASFTDNPFIGPPTLSINVYGAKNPEKIRHGEIWRALTAIFQSVGILDLFFSSGMLLCFGASVEARWGSIKWLFVYLASGKFFSFMKEFIKR
jgi:membrane associated rhomboid family serine protease